MKSRAIVKAATCAALVVLTVASCGRSRSSVAAAKPGSSPVFTTSYAQDAAVLASHIPGCASVAAADVGGGAASGIVAKASCTLQGHQVILYTWRDEESEARASAALEANGTGSYYAAGTGWTAILGDDTAAPQAVLGTVAAALAGSLHHYGVSPT